MFHVKDFNFKQIPRIEQKNKFSTSLDEILEKNLNIIIIKFPYQILKGL